jgi:hypothetical protein
MATGCRSQRGFLILMLTQMNVCSGSDVGITWKVGSLHGSIRDDGGHMDGMLVALLCRACIINFNFCPR